MTGGCTTSARSIPGTYLVFVPQTQALVPAERVDTALARNLTVPSGLTVGRSILVGHARHVDGQQSRSRVVVRRNLRLPNDIPSVG